MCYWGRSGEPFMNFQISTDFREMKRLCTFMMPFLYDWGFIFLSVVKFGARHRWKVIIWFDSIQIAHFMNVRFTSGSGQAEAGRCFLPCLFSSRLWFPWRLEDDWLHINSEPRSCGCHGVISLTLHLSLSVYQSCAFSLFNHSLTVVVTQPTLQRPAQASSTLPLEGALQSKLHREKWFWFYWRYKMFYQNPFNGFKCFLLIWLEKQVFVCACVGVHLY